MRMTRPLDSIERAPAGPETLEAPFARTRSAQDLGAARGGEAALAVSLTASSFGVSFTEVAEAVVDLGVSGARLTSSLGGCRWWATGLGMTGKTGTTGTAGFGPFECD